MKMLCLNYRECGQPKAVQELRLLVEQHSPEIVFFSETKMSADKARKLRFYLGFDNAIRVDSEGLSRGLVLLWKKGIIMRQRSKSWSHIDVWIHSENLGGVVWRFTGFYGQPQCIRRKESWYLLKFLRNGSDLPWICAGDFNEVILEEELFGSKERGEWRMAGFREAIQYCGFSDLGYTGLPYTWDNRQESRRNIKDNLQPDKVINYVPTKVTEDMNELLCKPFTSEEVEEALFMMKPNKSPGPYGFTTRFFQNHWNLIKFDICAAVLNFSQNGEMPGDLNKKIMVLIPKASKKEEERL